MLKRGVIFLIVKKDKKQIKHLCKQVNVAEEALSDNRFSLEEKAEILHGIYVVQKEIIKTAKRHL